MNNNNEASMKEKGDSKSTSEFTCSTKQEEPVSFLFDKYLINKLLGSGGFAKVYEAIDMITNQSVAIKVLNRQTIEESDQTAQIMREIAIMHRMRGHRNIITLHDVVFTDTDILLVMELARGGDLFDKLSANGRFSEYNCRRYFRQLISVVQYCHSLGVFHRDLKIENLLLDEDLNLKLSDFGLCATIDDVESDGLLHTLCGTPAYTAPEVFANKGYNGTKFDVWSCGVILYTLAIGCLPFQDCNMMNMFTKICRGQFWIPPWVSFGLASLLRRLLNPNPISRITIDEILRDPWFISTNK